MEKENDHCDGKHDFGPTHFCDFTDDRIQSLAHSLSVTGNNGMKFVRSAFDFVY
jgi:hypothetical protein